MYVLRFDLYNLRTKHPSIRIILYNYFSDSGQTGKTIPGHPDFYPENKEFQAPYIPPDSTVHKFHRPPSIEKCRTEESHGRFPAKAEIIAQKTFLVLIFTILVFRMLENLTYFLNGASCHFSLWAPSTWRFMPDRANPGPIISSRSA